MAEGILADYEQLSSNRRNGGTYVTDPEVPWRFVIHTTEAVPRSMDGARSMAERHAYPPHLWVWPEKDWKAQTVPLHRSAYALLHPRNTPHTNKMKAIQVEVIGFAKEMANKPDSFWEWIGREVLAPVVRDGRPINLDHIAPVAGGDGYGRSGSVRFPRDTWRRFDGICGHANVPDNEHWDPGRAELHLVAAAARNTLEDLMAGYDEPTAAWVVDHLYPAIARRSPDADGRKYWIGQLKNDAKNVVPMTIGLFEERNKRVDNDINGLRKDVNAVRARVTELEQKIQSSTGDVSVDEVLNEIASRIRS